MLIITVNLIVTDAQPWDQVFAIPGRIEAEDYHSGGSGVGYFDTTHGNSGGQYRSDDIDIEVTLDDGGGYDTGQHGTDRYYR